MPEIEKNNTPLERLEVVTVPIDAIKPNEYNPNRQGDHEFELLCRSMREDGFTQPVVVQRATNEIVDGEHRWRAAQAIGMTALPVVYVDMSAEQMKIATLRHNRARGSEDIDRAAEVLRDLEKLGVLDHAADSLMLDDVEMERLLADMGSPESAAGIDADLDAVIAAAGGEEQDGDRVNWDNATEGATQEALEAQRQRERLLAKARTEEQRQKVMAEAASMHRLMLMFKGDEGVVIKETLGPKPADKLIEILTWYEAQAA